MSKKTNDKWQLVLDRLETSLSQNQFSHFLNSTAVLDVTGLIITLNGTANIEALKHQLEDKIHRAIGAEFGEIAIHYQLPFYNLKESEPPMLRDYDSEFAELMYSSAESENRVSYKLNFVAITGDILAAIILSDLEFWFSPNKHGNSKLRVRQDSEYWIARTLNEWQEITGLTPRQTQRAIDKLLKLNLVVKQNYRFNGLKMMHLRINRKVFVEAVKHNRTV